MYKTPKVIWTEAALVKPGMRQHSLAGPREIASVVDAGDLEVIVSYTDGTTRPYARHEELPIVAETDPEFIARRGGDW